MVFFAAFSRLGGLGRRIGAGIGIAGLFLIVFGTIAVTIAITVAVTIFPISITISPSLHVSTVQDSSQKLTAGLLDLVERLLDQTAGSCTCTYHQNSPVTQGSNQGSIGNAAKRRR